MSLDRRAEELAAELEVERGTVKSDLENLVAYNVPIDEASDSLRRKYGSTGTGPSLAETSIDEISVTDTAVSVTCRVLTKGRRSIQYQGTEHVISEGSVADETGTIGYTAWEPFPFEAGDTISVRNAGVREWNDEPELNLGENTDVDVLDDTLSVPYLVGGERTLDAVAPGDRGVSTEVRVIEVERRTIDGRDGPTEILSGVLADHTARLPFTDWAPRSSITDDSSIRISDVYIREFRGVPSVNLSEFSTVEPLAEPVPVTDAAPRRSIGPAVAAGATYDLELIGSVVSIRDGSGLIQRCPECNRVIQRGECRTHGAVEGVDDLRVKAVIDDGTGTVTAILGTELTASIYGGDVESAAVQAREAMDSGVVADEIRRTILGRRIRVRGALRVDEYGATLDATEFERQESDPVDRAATLLAEVGR